MQREAFLYQQLKLTLIEQIRSGQKALGERLPSIRELADSVGLSKSTVINTYSQLEAEGYIQARPRSGYYVSWQARIESKQKPSSSKPVINPKAVSSSQILQEVMQQGAAFDLIHAQKTSGNELLKRSLARGQRLQGEEQQLYYDQPQGLPVLRQQIALRMAAAGSQVAADELIMTSGCQNAMLLALMAVTEPGDIVAVESPGFYGVFQLLRALQLKVVELPSSTETGVNPQALELVIGKWPVKALIVSPCYATPTGACMPEANKAALLQICRDKHIAIIEDDIYGDLTFLLQRPKSLYAMNPGDNVLLCSSFSKSLSRDLRIGWIAAGKYQPQVQQLKLVTSMASSQAVQTGLSHYLQHGHYDRYLRHYRQQLQQQCFQLYQLITEHLPMVRHFSQPQGGLCLWLELAPTIDTLALYHRAKAAGLLLTPGMLFTAQGRYKNCLRLSFQHEWSEARITAIQTLGMLLADNQ